MVLGVIAFIAELLSKLCMKTRVSREVKPPDKKKSLKILSAKCCRVNQVRTSCQPNQKVKRFQFNDKHFCQKKASATRDKLVGGRESS